MMTAHLVGLLTLALYGTAAVFSALRLLGKVELPRYVLLVMGSVALVCHFISVQQLIVTPIGINLGLFPIASLIAAFVVFISIAISLMRPLENMGVGIYPLSFLAVAASLTFSTAYEPIPDITTAIATHIVLSIFAYAVLAIAVVQALLIALQHSRLKRKTVSAIIKVLPPLQTMENVLFEIIGIGVLVLSLSIVTGFFFLDNLFAQHLAHKVFFTVLAWLVFCILLWGRHRLGWRGKTAIRWTFVGFTLLVVGFLGSKLVLEILLAG